MIIYLKRQITKLIQLVTVVLSKTDWYFFSKIILVFAAFIIPFSILYFLDPGSFDYLWKGRAPYLLFLWLFILEAALGWKKLKKEQTKIYTKKKLLIGITLLLPTIYALGLNLGIYNGIVELGRIIGVPVIDGDTWFLTDSWPFSFEYILLAAIFATSIWLRYGVRGLKTFSASAFFISGVGIFYMIDTFYPNGTFTILQSLVPITTSGVASILNLLGYSTEIWPAGEEGLYLEVSITGGEPYTAIIAWSCAGSHSLFLYSFMIMLFLRGTSISRTRRIIYVAVGAAGTFFINILRIVTIYLIGINSGESPAKLFHEFYGEFFFIAWMFVYLTIIFLLETRLIGKNKDKPKRDQSSIDIVQPQLPQTMEKNQND
jgi:thaumarchaeosortase